MKNFILVIVFTLFLTLNFFAQDSQTLNQQIVTLYQQGKFDEAISLGEKVIEIEKKAQENSENHAFAVTNLGFLYKEKAKTFKKKRETATREELQKIYETMRESAEKSKQLFREAIKIYEKSGNIESLGIASAKTELAWMSYNFIDSRTTEETRAQIDEAEKLYTEALAVQEKLAGINANVTLGTILAFGDFYMRWINFEKALPFYERYIESVEKTQGTKGRALVPALRAVSEILFITDREADAKKIAERISEITRKTETLNPSNPLLMLRARKIEKVKAKGFVPSAFSEKPSDLFSYAAGAGAVSQMGRVRVKQIFVKIVVDENGNVIEAKTDDNAKNKKEIEEAAMNSKFRPFIYKGTAYKMRGSISYAYLEN